MARITEPSGEDQISRQIAAEQSLREEFADQHRLAADEPDDATPTRRQPAATHSFPHADEENRQK